MMTKARPNPTPRDYWSTPDRVVRAVEDALGWYFSVDLAARADNAVCPAWIDEDDDFLTCDHGLLFARLLRGSDSTDLRPDGLDRTRRNAAWLNPPYSRGLIDQFVSRWVDVVQALEMPSVLLVHAKTSTSWYRHAASVACEIIDFDRRINHVPPDGISSSSNTNSSAAIVYDPWRRGQGVQRRVVSLRNNTNMEVP